MHHATFNTNFYFMAATVIPVLYLALTLQGPTSKHLLKRGVDESYKVLMLELSRPNRTWLRHQAEMWGRSFLVTGFIAANSIILASGFFAEPIAIVALYQQKISPFSAIIVLSLTIGLVAVVVGSQLFTVLTAETLRDRLKNEREQNQEESTGNKEGTSDERL